jgi:hypothetical protein
MMLYFGVGGCSAAPLFYGLFLDELGKARAATAAPGTS